MGANIFKGPIIDKTVFDKNTFEYRLGICEMQGWRSTMEDASIAHIHFDKHHSLFGIMDGHGGSIISRFVAYNFKKILISLDSYKQKKYEQALIETFLKLDEYLKDTKVNKFLYNLNDCYNSTNDTDNIDLTNTTQATACDENEFTLKYNDRVIHLQEKNGLYGNVNKDEDIGQGNRQGHIQVAKDMGTTANVVLMNDSTIYVANVGDSLSVMYKNGKAIKLNQEHKTTLKGEYDRIAKSGGRIINNRINGKLNLTRAIGDLSFKSNRNLKPYEQSVTSYPEITKIKRTEDIEFIVMGCDGLWDCVEPQKLCNNIAKRLKSEPNLPLSKIISDIFDQILSKSNNGN